MGGVLGVMGYMVLAHVVILVAMLLVVIGHHLASLQGGHAGRRVAELCHVGRMDALPMFPLGSALLPGNLLPCLLYTSDAADE